MKLTYWTAATNTDSPVYNIRAKTKKAVQAQLDTYVAQGQPRDDYGRIGKVVIVYDDGFDLMDLLCGEGNYAHDKESNASDT